jgi:serine/threonine protein kinase
MKDMTGLFGRLTRFTQAKSKSADDTIKRDWLELGELQLKTKSGEMKTFELKQNYSASGSSCLVYLAKDEDGQIVLLKEYYPAKGVARKKDGSLEPDQSQQGENVFSANINFIHREEFRDVHSELDPYICPAEPILYGNHTAYYVNTNSVSNGGTWDNAGEMNFFSWLEVAIGVSGFLSILHEKRIAYIDLKPDNVFLPYASSLRKIDYQHPKFFDFGSVLPFNQGKESYPSDEVHASEITAPGSYRSQNLAFNARIHISDSWDKICLAHSLLLRLPGGGDKFETGMTVEQKIQRLSASSMLNGCASETDRESLMELIRALLWTSGKKAKPVKEIHEKFKLLLAKTTQEAQDRNKSKLNMRFRIQKHLTRFTVGGTVAISIFLTLWLMILCIQPVSRMNLAWIIPTLLLFEGILLGLKLCAFHMANRTAALEVACRFQENSAYGDIASYLSGKRKEMTFQDLGKANQDRQSLRHFLWIALLVAVLACFAVSVFVPEVRAFPVFLGPSLLACFLFMHADYIPPTRNLYQSYAIYASLPNEPKTPEFGFAELFREEYLATKGEGRCLDLRAKYYQRTNLYTAKERAAQSDDGAWPADMPGEVIQQIYKMSWDRRKNVRLITTLALLAFNIAAAMVSLAPSLPGVIAAYFRIPTHGTVPFILLILIGSGIVNCWVILKAPKDSRITAEQAFYSRYLYDQEQLQKVFREDVKAGNLNAIAMKRGIYQHTARLITGNRKEREALRQLPRCAKMQFHHLAIGNQPRLALSVWLLFGFAACGAWFFWRYWMILGLAVVAAVVHYLLFKFWLPTLHKKKLIRLNEILDR